MPTVTNPILNLKRVGKNVKATVTYDLNLSRLESNLAALVPLGIRFSEAVEIFGVDAPGSSRDRFQDVIGVGTITVPIKDESQTLPRRFTRTFTRAELDEDLDLFIPDDDELVCRIRVLVHGLPFNPTDESTNVVTLAAGANNQPISQLGKG